MTNNAITPQYNHLYCRWYSCWDGCPPNDDGRGILHGHSCYTTVACPVTRVTAKRIYFRDGGQSLWSRERPEMFLDRAAIERDGNVYHRGMGELMHLAPPVRPDYRRRQESVAELRREMADCHPDVGGDPAEFRAAHARYVAAKAVTW